MEIKKEKLYMLSWIIIPFFGIWIAINYMIGITHHVSWDQTENNLDNRVLAATTSIESIPTFHKITYEGGGLITLWFDDAWSSQYLVALPIMEEKGFRGSLAVPTRLIGYNAYMSWAQVKRIQAKGWEINSHTRTHNCDPNNLSPNQVENELAGSKQDLLDHGIQADHFVTPCGADSAVIYDIAKKHYLSLRGSGTGFNHIPITEPYNLKIQAVHSYTTKEDIQNWVNEAKNTSSWLIIMFHQIDDGTTDYSTTPAKFNQMMDSIKESKVPVVLPSEVFQAVIKSSN